MSDYIEEVEDLERVFYHIRDFCEGRERLLNEYSDKIDKLQEENFALKLKLKDIK